MSIALIQATFNCKVHGEQNKKKKKIIASKPGKMKTDK